MINNKCVYRKLSRYHLLLKKLLYVSRRRLQRISNSLAEEPKLLEILIHWFYSQQMNQLILDIYISNIHRLDKHKYLIL